MNLSIISFRYDGAERNPLLNKGLTQSNFRFIANVNAQLRRTLIEKSELYFHQISTLEARDTVYLDLVAVEMDTEIDAIFISLVHRSVKRVPFQNETLDKHFDSLFIEFDYLSISRLDTFLDP